MHQLSFRQTIGLWGGLRPARRVSKVLGVMDVTATVRTIDPNWPASARVAAVHIGVEKFFWNRKRGNPQTIRRDIIEARNVLRHQGYTHIAVTGPFLLKIRHRNRLNEVHAVRNAHIISTPVCALYRMRLAAWGWLARKRNAGLAQLRTAAVQGFTEHGVFAL